MKFKLAIIFVLLNLKLIFSQNNINEKINYQDTLKNKNESKEIKKSKNINNSSSAELNKLYDLSSHQNTRRNLTTTEINKINPLLKDIKKTNLFEYHFFSYAFSDFSKEKFFHLQKAKELNTNYSSLDYYFVYNYEIYSSNKENKKNEYLKSLYKNKLIDEELIKYAKHLLVSTDYSSFLIVHGKDDFFPLIYVQEILETRKDVKVISLDLMRNEDYKNNLLKYNLKFPTKKIIDVSFLKEFLKLNSNKNIQISLTVPKEYISSIEENWYFKGLCITMQGNNINQNENILETLSKDKDFYYYNNTKTKNMSSNYLPFLILLNEKYQKNNNDDKADKTKLLIEKIKKQSNR